MSMLQRLAASVLPSLLGAAVGGACVLAYAASHDAPEAKLETTEGSPPRLALRPTQPAADEARAEHAPRAAARDDLAEPAAEASEAAEVAQDERPDLEQAVYEDHQAFQGRLALHDAEREDRGWAAPAAASLDEELGALAERGGFSVGDVDCRSRSCSAAVAWPNLESAMRSMETLALASYETNCTRTVHLGEGMEGGGEVRGTVLFECERG